MSIWGKLLWINFFDAILSVLSAVQKVSVIDDCILIHRSDRCMS